LNFNLNEMISNTIVTLTSKLSIKQALKNVGINDPATVTSLAITGKLTDKDMKYIRENMAETLQVLNLVNASFPKNIIPDRAFENCTGLTSVCFPDTIVEIGYDAFAYCLGVS